MRDDAVVDVRIALGACFGSGYSRTYTHAVHIYIYIYAGDNAFAMRAFVRSGYANSLTLICRGNTRKIAKTFCWRTHYWSAKIDRITRNAVKVDRGWSAPTLQFYNPTAGPSLRVGSEGDIARLCARRFSRHLFSDASAASKKNGRYFDIRLIAVAELTAKTAVFCGRFAFVV